MMYRALAALQGMSFSISSPRCSWMFADEEEARKIYSWGFRKIGCSRGKTPFWTRMFKVTQGKRRRRWWCSNDRQSQLRLGSVGQARKRSSFGGKKRSTSAGKKKKAMPGQWAAQETNHTTAVHAMTLEGFLQLAICCKRNAIASRRSGSTTCLTRHVVVVAVIIVCCFCFC